MRIWLRFVGLRDGSGYSQHLDGDPDDGGVCYEIVPRGGPLLHVEIESHKVCAFGMLSAINPKDASEINALCDEYGFPDSAKPDRLSLDEFSEAWTELDKMLRRAHKRQWSLFEHDATKILSETAPSPEHQYFRCLRVPGNHEPQLVLECRNLFRFALLQLCGAVAEGQEIKKCPNCDSYFPAGGSSGRKKDGVYCSTRCRVAAHRAKA